MPRVEIQVCQKLFAQAVNVGNTKYDDIAGCGLNNLVKDLFWFFRDKPVTIL